MKRIVFLYSISIYIFFISIGALIADKIQIPSEIVLVNNTDYLVGIENLETVNINGLYHHNDTGKKVLDFEPTYGRGTHHIPLENGQQFAGSTNQDEAHIIIKNAKNDVTFGTEKDSEDALSEIRIQNGFTKNLEIPEAKKKDFGNYKFLITVSASKTDSTDFWAPIYIITVTQNKLNIN